MSATAAAPADPAGGTAPAVPACGGEPVLLDRAVLRSWSTDADGALVLSLLVPSTARGFRSVRLYYAEPRLVDRAGSALTDLPLTTGRRYVLRGEERRHDEEGYHHTMSFFPAPEFTISATAVRAEE